MTTLGNRLDAMLNRPAVFAWHITDPLMAALYAKRQVWAADAILADANPGDYSPAERDAEETRDLFRAEWARRIRSLWASRKLERLADNPMMMGA